jgi:Protein of unknown function (DUF3748)/WD40-like Beta Propeller Repeat
MERQLTSGPGGRILTNTGVWSPDGKWIVYDTRSDAAGDRFDGTRIEAVNVETSETRVLYQSQHGAHCGVATWHPHEAKVAFILGPEQPTDDWTYAATRRQGVIVEMRNPGVATQLDARDLMPPFTPGALRGGSHVHVFHPQGDWVSFTYEDQFLTKFRNPAPQHDLNLRNVAVSVPGAVDVPKNHPRNHSGAYFSVVVTRTTAQPTAGSDEIQKAFEEAWIGTHGYRKTDGRWQNRALAFQGHVLTRRGETISELFVVDLPDDLRIVGDGPLAGSETRMPFPPQGTLQRRLTFTEQRKQPGIQGPRHWVRSSPCGSRIAFLMKDDAGIVQLWTISPNGGEPMQMTHTECGIASAFTWSPEGTEVAFVTDERIAIANATTGELQFLTEKRSRSEAPRPEACVFSPDGKSISFVRRLQSNGSEFNQICVAER